MDILFILIFFSLQIFSAITNLYGSTLFRRIWDSLILSSLPLPKKKKKRHKQRSRTNLKLLLSHPLPIGCTGARSSTDGNDVTYDFRVEIPELRFGVTEIAFRLPVCGFRVHVDRITEYYWTYARVNDHGGGGGGKGRVCASCSTANGWRDGRVKRAPCCYDGGTAVARLARWPAPRGFFGSSKSARVRIAPSGRRSSVAGRPTDGQRSRVLGLSPPSPYVIASTVASPATDSRNGRPETSR